MRTVFVFPGYEQVTVSALLDGLSPAQSNPWVVDDNLYVDLRTEHTGMYDDWDVEDITRLTLAAGRRPTWGITVDVSGRIDGTSEVRGLVLTILGDGGVAVDDYSGHAWTSEEIAANVMIDGLRFFDFKTYHQRSGDAPIRD